MSAAHYLGVQQHRIIPTGNPEAAYGGKISRAIAIPYLFVWILDSGLLYLTKALFGTLWEPAFKQEINFALSRC